MLYSTKPKGGAYMESELRLNDIMEFLSKKNKLQIKISANIYTVVFLHLGEIY